MTTLRARTIVIIGAGPSGLAAAKYLRAERAFDKITIYEQRPSAGGIWNITPDERTEDLLDIPQTNPNGKNQNLMQHELRNDTSRITNDINGGKQIPTFLSPVYEKLETNIPRGLMSFQDLEWPQDSQLFPKHETVLQYIRDYGADVQDLVRYSTQVISVTPADSSFSGSWSVVTQNLISGEEKKQVYDAVIVANGHFIVPYIPNISGIAEWNTLHPGLITHSKYYRRPEEFSGKKVIVVGNSASGVDISSQILPYCNHPLLWSVQSASIFSSPPSSSLKPEPRHELPPILEFLPASRGVVFADGTIEHDIDAIVFATGYFYSLPFLSTLTPELILDGTHVQHTYQHLFYYPRPTLSFLTLPQRAIPFPIAEAQSAVLARVYSGRLPIPTLSKMQEWESKTERETGGGRNFHVLSFPKDGNYINELGGWASEAESRDGLENNGRGKVGPKWGAWEFWCREIFADIRTAFREKGEERHHIRKLEELGFDDRNYRQGNQEVR